MSEDSAKQEKAEKKRRLVGEVRTALRLTPFLKPYVAGIIFLILVTLIYAGANAGRAWLVRPLFNHVLIRKSSVATPPPSRVKPENVEKSEADALAGFDPTDQRDLKKDDLGLGPSPIPRFKTIEPARNEKGEVDTNDPLPPAAHAIIEAREAINDAADQVLREPESNLLTKIVDLFRKKPASDAEDLTRINLLKAIRVERAVEQLYHTAQNNPRIDVGRSELRTTAALAGRARDFANEATFGRLWDDLLGIFVATMLIAVVLGSFYFLMFYQARKLTTMMAVDVQNQLAKHLLTLSIRYFNDKKRGELFSRLTNDLQNLQQVLMIMLSDTLIQPLQLVVLAAVAVWLCPPLSLSLLVLALTVVIPVRILGKKIRRSARSRQASVANVLEAMQQMFAGIRIVKVFGREDYEMARLRTRTDEYCQTSLKVVSDRTKSKAWMEFVNDVTVPIVLLLGGMLVIRHMWGLDLGTFGAFLGLVVLMYMPAKTFAASYNTLQDAMPSVERVFEILDARSEIQDAPDAVALPRLKGEVKFEDVSFSYNEGSEILKGITFTAKVGEVCAVVGPTAAGKSTLVDLLMRFYDPTSGKITIDGLDLKKVKLASLLEKIAVVTQDPFLFNDTIKENIRYGRLDATDAEIEAAAKTAKIHDEIVAKEKGYLENVGERGAKLSGGQRQRITIARAILKNPEILILDEAMSALDANTEKRVQEALEELEHGRTTFVIAHRLSTVQHAHKILVVYEGRLVEEGRHDELVAKGGIYAGLAKNLSMMSPSTDLRPANGNGTHEKDKTVEVRA